MKLVKVNGGYSIAVYQNKKKKQADDLINDHRVNFIAPASYKENSGLDKLVKEIISEIKLKDDLVRQHIKQKTR